METPNQKPAIPWLALLGACGVLVLLACMIATAVGAGGLLLTSRIMRNNRASTSFDPQFAQIETARGWIEVQSTGGEWGPVEPGELVEAGQRVRTGSLSSASLLFYDGSRAVLPQNSEISIDELDFEKKSGKRTILMTQISGESDHEVAKNKNRDSQYEVRTPSGTGQAKGTEFHVIVTEERTAYYYVTEGTVAVTGMEATVLVNAGQMTIILIGQPPLEPVMTVTGQGVVTQIGETWVIGEQTFVVNEETTITGDPKVGDWVLVKGRLLEDETKVADQIFLLRAAPVNEFRLSGVVEALGETEWKVNGQTILVTAESEIDEGIIVGDTVNVEGQVLPGGQLQADRIQRIDEELGTPFEFTGIIEETSESAWSISGVEVAVDAETQIAEGLEAGMLVHVSGYIREDGTWLATNITAAEETDRSFEFTGTPESKDPWKVSGIAFETREWTEIDDDLDIGDRVRVEGKIDDNGVWIADEIEKLEEDAPSTLVLIGTVFSMDPWIISGIPLQVTDLTVIDGEIKVGMLVRVELVLGPDGVWQIIKIEPLDTVVWFPSCVDVIAEVVSVSGSQVQLLNWPLLELDDEVQIEGAEAVSVLVPGSIVRIRICFDEDMIIRITYILIIEVPDVDVPIPDSDGGKVTVCHKPGKKKGGHTLSISESALPAHLGHGDYQGACR